MKEINEQISSLIDNENVGNEGLQTLIDNDAQQMTFSRYQLMGDVMRNETAVNIDITESLMKEINFQPVSSTVSPANIAKPTNNVVPFMKRFGQYAIAASVAGVVVMTSFLTSQPTVESNGIEVLNTTPFGGAVSPVSLQTKPEQSKKYLQERQQRLEALLKDHQLQLQAQP